MALLFSEKFTYKFPNSIQEIDTLSGKDFERFLFEYFKLFECAPILTDDRGDRGIDLQIFLNDETGAKKKVGIQAKRWKQPVGSNEISQILQGKAYYGCDDLWIITTSKLTAQAQNTALNSDIKILTRVDVIDMLNEIKSNPKAKFRETASSVSSPEKIENEAPTAAEKKPFVQTVSKDSKNPQLFDALVLLRREIGKEQKVDKLYLIYNNETIENIITVMPYNEKGLKMIRGLGDKKIQDFGDRILALVKKYKK